MFRKRSRPVTTTTTTTTLVTGVESRLLSNHTINNPTTFHLEKSTTMMSLKEDSTNNHQYTMISPSSVLDNKIFPKQNHNHHHSWENSGIIVALTDTTTTTTLKPKHTTTRTRNPKLVVFGTHQLRIQIPQQQQQQLQFTPIEFGIKTPRSLDKTTTGDEFKSRRRKSVSMEEMEMLSEDYTCVISRGPNPKTTHIFGNRVVECSSSSSSSSYKEKKKKREVEEEDRRNCLSSSCACASSSEEEEMSMSMSMSMSQCGSFISRWWCCLCKSILGDASDIYMYRGEKAFCSQECRDQGMLLFDGLINDDDESS